MPPMKFIMPKDMKAECIKQFKHLEGILDKGDIVEIETLKSFDGSYMDWKFKSKNGLYYNGAGITNRIGKKTLFDIFKKVV